MRNRPLAPMPVGIVLEASAHLELHGMRKICCTKLA